MHRVASSKTACPKDMGAGAGTLTLVFVVVVVAVAVSVLVVVLVAVVVLVCRSPTLTRPQTTGMLHVVASDSGSDADAVSVSESLSVISARNARALSPHENANMTGRFFPIKRSPRWGTKRNLSSFEFEFEFESGDESEFGDDVSVDVAVDVDAAVDVASAVYRKVVSAVPNPLDANCSVSQFN